MAILTDLPQFRHQSPKVFTTLHERGEWISNRNWGDGQPILVRLPGGPSNWKWMMTARTGVPATGGTPNGCQFWEAPYGDGGGPFAKWSYPTGPSSEFSGLELPYKAIQSNHVRNSVNIDTASLCYIPTATGGPVYVSVHGCRPGLINEGAGEGGFKGEIHAWQTQNPTRLPEDWTWPSPGTPLISPDQHPEATWTQPYGGPSNFDGGCDECSIVYDPETDLVEVYWEGEYEQEPAEWNGSIRRHAIGRATAPASSFGPGLTPTFTWTPTPGSDSYIWRPKENGMKSWETYGTTNATAVPGTSERVTMRSNVTIDPDNPHMRHMVLQQKTPNTGGGAENRTSGIFHYYSAERGVKGSWVADRNNPLVTWFSHPALDLYDNGQANKMNSTFLLWDPLRKKVTLGVWFNNWGIGAKHLATSPKPGGARNIGNQLVGWELSIDQKPGGFHRRRRAIGSVRTRRVGSRRFTG